MQRKSRLTNSQLSKLMEHFVAGSTACITAYLICVTGNTEPTIFILFEKLLLQKLKICQHSLVLRSILTRLVKLRLQNNAFEKLPDNLFTILPPILEVLDLSHYGDIYTLRGTEVNSATLKIPSDTYKQFRERNRAEFKALE